MQQLRNNVTVRLGEMLKKEVESGRLLSLTLSTASQRQERMVLLKQKDGHSSVNSFLTTYPSVSRVLQCLVLSKLFSFKDSLSDGGDDCDDDDNDGGRNTVMVMVVVVSIWVPCKN